MSATEYSPSYLTADVPPVPGTIKLRYEDFRVEEIPAYEASGQGEHVLFCIEKSGLSTSRALGDIARALGVKRRDIGVAGQKDARAVTRQVLSVQQVPVERVSEMDVPRVSVVWAERHGNKLRMGHHRGNRFQIRLRDTEPERVGEVVASLERLVDTGMPNIFGSQRFGARGDTWQVGRALLGGDYRVAAEVIAGQPGPLDTGSVLRAREFFAAGSYEESAATWPRGYGECARLSHQMAKCGGNAKKAIQRLDRRTIGFYISAYQGWLFNQVVAERLDRLGTLEQGDLAWKHVNGACFTVEDPHAEQPRADQFEISPTGPLFGPKMSRPGGEPAAAEQRVLDGEGIGPELFAAKGPLRAPGGRRPLRVCPQGAGASAGEDEHGPYIELRFSLPPGSYATVLIGEICKDQLREAD